jgi:hypothetical protein
MSTVEEFRLHERTYYPAPAGRTYYLIVCPFCGCSIEVRAWSLGGSGKRCECGALHSWYGTHKKRTR